MKNLFALLMLLAFSTSGLAQYKNVGVFQFVEKKSDHTVKVIFKAKEFNRSAHKITYANQNYLLKREIAPAKGRQLMLKVDGREPLGTDGNVPNVEIESVKFLFDGKPIIVPRRLYTDCYNPNFEKDYLKVRLSDDLQSAFVFMSGSDAAGSYQVVWVLRKDGRHTRFSGSCPDCGFIDFKGGFFYEH